MKPATKISPEAMLIFLKQAALEANWTVGYLAKALGLPVTTAKQVAAEMALAGYAEPVRGKAETWRNTESGNKLAGVHGVASELTRTALALAKERGLKVVPVCSFVATYIRRHPAYQPILQ